MSKFLAPIHTWLFNKIKLHEDLEKKLIQKYQEKYGSSILQIAEAAEITYGAPLQDLPIEDLIDTSNIHGWLQNRISIAETRLASILAETIKLYGDEAKKIALTAYQEQGTLCGTEAQDTYDLSTAPMLYDGLNQYLLNGMPCDNVNMVSLKEEKKLQWKISRCLHRSYWEEAGADIPFMYVLRDAWISYFIVNANPQFEYKVFPLDTEGFLYEISHR